MSKVELTKWIQSILKDMDTKLDKNGYTNLKRYHIIKHTFITSELYNSYKLLGVKALFSVSLM